MLANTEHMSHTCAKTPGGSNVNSGPVHPKPKTLPTNPELQDCPQSETMMLLKRRWPKATFKMTTQIPDEKPILMKTVGPGPLGLFLELGFSEGPGPAS